MGLGNTWIDNPALEALLRQVFDDVDKTFSEQFDSVASDQEERLTGDLLRLLQERARSVTMAHFSWSAGTDGSLVRFSLQCRNTTVNKSEKRNGADMAFILSVFVLGKMQRTKVVFVQAKKMNVDVMPIGLAFHPSWKIDLKQLRHLVNSSQSSYYFLYGPSSTSTNIRVIPATTVRGIMKASAAKTAILQSQVMPASRSFAEFLLDDFIGCWVGDERDRVLNKARGEDVEFPVRNIIEVKFSSE